MPIVEIKKSVRPNTSVLPIEKTNHPGFVAHQQAIFNEFGAETVLVDTPEHRKISRDNGSVIVEGQFDSTGLILTRTSTFADLDVYNRIENILTVEFDYIYKQYFTDNNITTPATGQYIQTGIATPFSCTTTYNFPAGTLESDSMMLGFARFLQNSNKLESFTNTATQIVAVHHYLDSADFTEYHFKDFQHIGFLHDAGATRTISYAML